MFGIFQLRPISSPLLGYNCSRRHATVNLCTLGPIGYSRSHIPDIKLVPTALCITFFSASNSRLSSRSFFFPLLHPSLVPSLIYVHGHHSAVHVSQRHGHAAAAAAAASPITLSSDARDDIDDGRFDFIRQEQSRYQYSFIKKMTKRS